MVEHVVSRLHGLEKGGSPVEMAPLGQFLFVKWVVGIESEVVLFIWKVAAIEIVVHSEKYGRRDLHILDEFV